MSVFSLCDVNFKLKDFQSENVVGSFLKEVTGISPLFKMCIVFVNFTEKKVCGLLVCCASEFEKHYLNVK